MSDKLAPDMPARHLQSCGEVSCELLVNPIPRPEPDPITITLRPRQRRVTLVDHSKPNSATILGYAGDVLRQQGVEVAELLVKPDASVAMPAALLKSLAQEPGLVLCGVSD